MSEVLEDPYAEAERRGLKVVESDPFHLQLDLDGDAVVNEPVLALLEEAGFTATPAVTLQTRSQHGGSHIYIKLKRSLWLADRIALQAALGSDARREVRSLLRDVNHTRAEALVLFETEAEYERVQRWLGRNPDVVAQTVEEPERHSDTVTDDFNIAF